ncbi:hypothetical protein BSL78_06493 [Apostichopus japonicus]|uniref:Ig-like domain-containing protein n=1 Tax=Stichopus japonicus TaxID=307972 RepID=A0A2G8L8P4_STIJA|nr:hypothetical protein BSL78_06493 [Apostichopus japonicus]
MFSSLFMLSIIVVQGFCQTCLSNQYVERMETKTIYCDVGGNVEGYYWYQGSISLTKPILKLENGVKGGEKYDDDHYDITSEGNMKIINARLEQEASYTYAVIFENGTVWRRSISVLIIVTPTPPCPLVQSCSNCDECIVGVKSNNPTSLTCYIEQVRPNVTLYWSVEGHNTTFTEQTSFEIKNNITDAWNISTTILFELKCAEYAIFRCSVYYDRETLTIGNKTVNIRSEECNDDNTKQTSSPTQVIVTCVLAVLGITLFALAIFYYKLHRRHGGRQGTLLEEVKQTDVLEGLKQVSFSDSWCGDCQLTITYEDNGTSRVNNTYDLLEALSRDERVNRVLFVGEPGIGKSHLFRDISRKWKNGDILKDVILIYLQLQYLSKDACILDELMKMLNREMSVEEANSLIFELERKDSIVMLDGISNWSRLHYDDNNISNVVSKKRLTVEHILKGFIGNFRNMKFWVTSCNIDNDLNVMNKPYTRVDVLGFTEIQRTAFFEKFWEENKDKQIGENMEEYRMLKEKQQESKDQTPNPEARPLNYKLAEDIIENWQSQLETVYHCKDFITQSPLIARLFASIQLHTNRDDNTMLEQNLFLFFKNNNAEKLRTIKNLVKNGNFDLLACLMEVGTQDEEKYKEYAQMLQMKKLVFHHSTEEYYQDAILHLLKMCKETKTTVESLEIYGDFPIVQLSGLPNIDDRLVFHGVHLANKDKFKVVMDKVPHMTKTIQFNDSEIPERLSPDEVQDIVSIENTEVFRKTEDASYERLCKDGEWEKWTSE